MGSHAMRQLARPAGGPLRVVEQRRSRLSTTEAAAMPSSPVTPSLATSRVEEEAQDAEAQCTYNAERVIGNGTFGIVYSAHIVETNETVAIKKVFVDRRYRNRELQVWRQMHHPNIVTCPNV